MRCNAAGIITEVLRGAAPLGVPFLDLLDGGSLGKARRFVAQVALQGAVSGWEFNVLAGDSAEAVQFTGLLDDDGGYRIIAANLPPGFEQAARLHNELVSSQRDLGRQNASLERVNRELQQFAATVSHDLRAPLRNIRLLIGLFESKAPQLLDERAALWLSHIVANAERMQRLLDRTLEYASAEGAPLRLEAVPLNEVVDVTANPYVTRGDLPAVQGDRVQLERLFQNLFDNALAYRREETPRIEVHARPAGSYWRIAVSDNGLGIASADQSRIFEMFGRVNPRGEGVGIGLATCRQVVHRHQGEIWVKSGLGEGSTFYVTLPAAATSPELGSRPVDGIAIADH
ncbi:MAG: hypothetical protein K2X03_06855 [Bryobacteraceae bacterium]|nr:hypothetical protein [Bryobacteraceae bacterium]